MEISFDNLLMGALLEFGGVVDSLDMMLLVANVMNFSNFKVNNRGISKVLKYIDYQDGVYRLKKELDTEIIKGKGITYKDYLKFYLGNTSFWNNFSKEEFVLKKIKFLKEINKEKMELVFRDKQREILALLEAQGYVAFNWYYDEDAFKNCEKLVVTKAGEVYIFISENKKLIENFKEQLIEVGLSKDYILEYLEISDLTRPKDVILNVANYQNALNLKGIDVRIKLKKRV